VLASSGVYLTAVVPVLLGSAGAWLWRRQPSICAGLLIFAGGVTPVLGLAPFDFQMYSTVGDHYLYLSMVGPAVALAGILAARAVAQAIALAMIVMLAVLAQRQAWTWRTLESMNRHTISVNPKSWASHHNLAVALSERDRLDEAHSSATEALRLRPDDPFVRRTAAMVLLRQADDAVASGRTDDALRLYEQGLTIQPDNPLLWTNLAATLAELGRFEQAIALYERAITAAPDDSAAARAGIQMLRSIRRPAPTTGPN
jgi:tetratricopeptide (TPR) repeat protein